MSSDPKRLTRKAHDAIREARQSSGVAIAEITLWELAWLAEHHRVAIAGSVESFVRETISRVIVRPMTPEIVALAVRLPETFPKDPADRIIPATAIVKGLPLVTGADRIQRSKVAQTVWYPGPLPRAVSNRRIRQTADC